MPSSSPSSPLVSPSPSSSTRCRYTSSSSGRDRFSETTLFTAPDPDGPALTPACQAVMIALLEKRVPFNHVLVRPEDRPADFADLYAAVTSATPHDASPPLLADCGAMIAGTSQGGARVLLEYMADKYAASGTPLIPPNAAAAASMRLFVDVFAEAVVPPYSRFVRAKGAAAATRAKRELMQAWSRVDAFLLAHSGGAAAGFDALDAGAEQLFGQHRAFVVRPRSVADGDEEQQEEDEGTLDGSPHVPADPVVDRGEEGFEEPPFVSSPFAARSSSSISSAPYLLGRSYSLAEVAATPYVARMAALLPALRGFELVRELKAAGLGRAAQWAEACLARPSAIATDPTADEMVGGLAAAEWARVM